VDIGGCPLGVGGCTRASRRMAWPTARILWNGSSRLPIGARQSSSPSSPGRCFSFCRCSCPGSLRALVRSPRREWRRPSRRDARRCRERGSTSEFCSPPYCPFRAGNPARLDPDAVDPEDADGGRRRARPGVRAIALSHRFLGARRCLPLVCRCPRPEDADQPSGVRQRARLELPAHTDQGTAGGQRAERPAERCFRSDHRRATIHVPRR
jgi:hypothetical protein